MISNFNNSNEIIVVSDIYGAKFSIYAGGVVGRLAKDEISSGLGSQNSALIINNSSFESRISLTLRDLKHNSDEAMLNNSTFYVFRLGKIVANSSPSFAVSGTGLTYKDSYTNLLSFKHTVNGNLIQYVQENNPIQLFIECIVSGQTPN